MMEDYNDSIVIKTAETDEELCGRGYVHCTAWQEAYRGIVSDRYLDTMTVEATTARARQFPESSALPYTVLPEMMISLTQARSMRSMSCRNTTTGRSDTD